MTAEKFFNYIYLSQNEEVLFRLLFFNSVLHPNSN